MIYCFVRRCCIVAVAPPPHHPSKVETCYGHVCLATTPDCAAPHENSWLHFSSVLYSSVTERLPTEHEVVGSNHRQTDGFKSEEKIARSWSCDQCHVWSVVLGVGWKIGVKRRLAQYLICTGRSFSVDSCVRKHAKVYGENLQPCFKTRIKHELMPIRGSEFTRRAASSGFLATNRHLRMLYLA